MATEKKSSVDAEFKRTYKTAVPATIKRALSSGRPFPPWMYQLPDDRNRLIEEARELIAAYLYCRNKNENDYKAMDKSARRWLKETKQ